MKRILVLNIAGMIILTGCSFIPNSGPGTNQTGQTPPAPPANSTPSPLTISPSTGSQPALPGENPAISNANVNISNKTVKPKPSYKRTGRINVPQEKPQDIQPSAASLLKQYDQILSKEPDNYNVINKKAGLLLKEGNYKAAINNLELILTYDPDNKEALTNIGLAYAQSGKNKKALEFYDKALKLRPGNQDIIANKCDSYARLKINTEALQCYEQLIKINPSNSKALSGKAAVLTDLGQQVDPAPIEKVVKSSKPVTSTVAKVNKSSTVSSADKNVLYTRGLMNMNNGQLEQALQCFDRALKADPDNKAIRMKKGEVLIQLGRDSEAEELLNN